MKVKLLRELLIGSSDTMPARRGTVLEIDDDRGRQWVAAGLAVKSGSEVGIAEADPVVSKKADDAPKAKKK